MRAEKWAFGWGVSRVVAWVDSMALRKVGPRVASRVDQKVVQWVR